MKNDQIAVLIVTPIYHPAPGGAAQYTKILAESLLRHPNVKKTVILTEAHPGMLKVESIHNGDLTIFRSYPHRAGRATKNFSSYLRYLIQNIMFFNLPHIVKKTQSEIVMLHGSFLLHPSTIGGVIHALRKLRPSGVRLVADIRDPLLPTKSYSRLYGFDGVICCSLRLFQKFKNDVELAPKISIIPIPLQTVHVEDSEVHSVLSRHDLTDRRFVFTANGISDRKGFPALFDTWRELLRRGHNLDLVVAGRKRSWRDKYGAQVDNGALRYLGNVPNRDVLCLCKASEIVVNTSTVEGIPRMSLEAMQVGARVLLPPNVPEFETLTPIFIASSQSPTDLASQIEYITSNRLTPVDYDLSLHEADRVADNYLGLFTKLVGNVGRIRGR